MYKVYLLPKCNYVGYTTRFQPRVNEHKCHHGRDTTDARVLYATDSLDEAQELELLLHDIGYLGGRRELKSKGVLDTSTGIYYDSIKQAWKAYDRHSYRYFLEMLQGRKNNKTNYIYT